MMQSINSATNEVIKYYSPMDTRTVQHILNEEYQGFSQ
jgi:hypothetical protein